MNLRQTILVLGDIALLYLSLVGALLISGETQHTVSEHIPAFTVLFAVWIGVFYAAGCYDLHRLKNSLAFSQLFAYTLLANALLSVLFFYAFFPFFDISPKTNLFLFVAIFALAGYEWRIAFNALLGRYTPALSIVFVGSHRAIDELSDIFAKHPQSGYRVQTTLEQENWYERLIKIPAAKRNIVVLPGHLPHSTSFTHADYARAAYESTLTTLPDFYEYIMKRVLLAELDASWLTSNVTSRRTSYEKLLRPIERIAAATLFFLLSPLLALIALCIALTSPGGPIYRQRRVGKNGAEFTLYKFRTMRKDAEKEGVRWSSKNDTRITPIGRILRRSHLDELPQLLNIMAGHVVFVGPRPERPEFVQQLGEKVPYYDLRHLVPPGITGWAQIHYRYGSSIADAKRKLEFDLYYIKHRSLLIDLRILLRTFKLFFVTIS